MSQGCYVVMPEGGDAMSHRSRLSMLMSLGGMLEGLPRMLVSRQVIRFPLLLPGPMSMRRTVVQLSGSLVVLVV